MGETWAPLRHFSWLLCSRLPHSSFALTPLGGANHKLILGVVYKEKPSHHLLQKEPDHTYTVNGKRTELSRLADVLAFLTTKRPWWPVPLTTGIPLAP